MSNPINTTGTAVPSSLPNPVTVTDGLVIRGNVFVNWKADPKYTMGLGITACAPDADCYAPTVSHASFPQLHLSLVAHTAMRLVSR